MVNTGHIKHLDDICGGDRSINTKGDVLTGELIDHVADLYRAPTPAPLQVRLHAGALPTPQLNVVTHVSIARDAPTSLRGGVEISMALHCFGERMVAPIPRRNSRDQYSLFTR